MTQRKQNGKFLKSIIIVIIAAFATGAVAWGAWVTHRGFCAEENEKKIIEMKKKRATTTKAVQDKLDSVMREQTDIRMEQKRDMQKIYELLLRMEKKL